MSYWVAIVVFFVIVLGLIYVKTSTTQTTNDRVAGASRPSNKTQDEREMTLFDEARIDELRIDVVYTWVDGSDPQWQSKQHSRKSSHSAAHDDHDRGRYQDFDELRYSLRSLFRYAPWVRNVYIVTDNQVPQWLDLETAKSRYRILIVDHRDIIPEQALPTFNSIAIETCLHRIKGLSETFLYLNDDVFLDRPMAKSDFFEHHDRRIVPRLFAEHSLPLSKTLVEQSRAKENKNGFDYGMIRCWEALLARKSSQHLRAWIPQHAPFSCIRSKLETLEHEYHHEIELTRQSPFRGQQSCNFINGLWFHLAGTLCHAKYLDQSRVSSSFYSCDSFLEDSSRKNESSFFCINECDHSRLCNEQSYRQQLLDRLQKRTGGPGAKLACEVFTY